MSKFRSISKVSAVAAAVGMTASMALPVCAAPSASEFYADAIRKNAAASAAGITELYQMTCASYNAASGDDAKAAVATNLYIEPGEGFDSLLGGMKLGIKPGTKIGFSGTSSLSGTDFGGDYKIYVNNNTIANASLVGIGDTLYASIPTISSSWISITADELMESVSAMMPEDSGTTEGLSADATSIDMSKFDFFNGEVLTQERVDRLVKTYTDIYLKYATDVEINEKVDVTVGEFSDTYTEAAVTLSGEQLIGLTTDIITTAEKDEDIKAIWTSFGLSSEDYDSIFKELKGSLAESGKELADATCIIDLYFNDQGVIMGEAVSVSSESQPSANTYSSMMIVENETGDASAVEGHAATPVFSYDYIASGSTDATGKVEFNGKTYVDINEYDDKGNVSQINQRYGFSYSGTANDGLFKMSGVVSDTDKFTLQVRMKDDIGAARLNYFTDDQKVFTAVFTAQDAKFKEIKAPTENVYSMAKDDEFAAYMATVDPTNLLASIEGARGDLGDFVTSMILEAVKSVFAPESADATAAAAATTETKETAETTTAADAAK